jgi:hypothetical protein
MNNDQIQSSTTPSNNDEHLIKVIADEMNKLDKKFESKMNLMEVKNDNLQKELTSLKQKEIQHDKENKCFRDEQTMLKVAIQALTNNDLNYDSSDDGILSMMKLNAVLARNTNKKKIIIIIVRQQIPSKTKYMMFRLKRLPILTITRLIMRILGMISTWIERFYSYECTNECLAFNQRFIPTPLLQIKELLIYRWQVT